MVITPKVHKVGVDVELHLRPTLVEPHRVAVIKNNDIFEISLDTDVNKVIIMGRSFLKERETRFILDGVRSYRKNFLTYYERKSMVIEELSTMMTATRRLKLYGRESYNE